MNIKFRYPKWFIEKTKELYPDWENLHKLISQNNIKEVSKMIENTKNFPLDENQIIKLFSQSKQNSILNIAKRTVERRKLFLDFKDLLDNFETKVEKHP